MQSESDSPDDTEAGYRCGPPPVIPVHSSPAQALCGECESWRRVEPGSRSSYQAGATAGPTTTSASPWGSRSTTSNSETSAAVAKRSLKAGPVVRTCIGRTSATADRGAAHTNQGPPAWVRVAAARGGSGGALRRTRSCDCRELSTSPEMAPVTPFTASKSSRAGLSLTVVRRLPGTLRTGRAQVWIGVRGCRGSMRWPSTIAAARSISLRLSVRECSRSISNAPASAMRWCSIRMPLERSISA